MIGNGVGIAPMRAFCQERASCLLRGDQSMLGETMVIFGTRTKGDKLFDWDFETAVKVGALQHYHVAYSREEQRAKQYAQELVEEHADLVVDMLKHRRGVVYVCGSNPLRKGVIEALNLVFAKQGDPQFAQTLMQQGRIMFECFGGGS